MFGIFDELSDISVPEDHGSEMQSTDSSSLGRLLAEQLEGPIGKEIHVLAGNLSAHKTKLVAEFLMTHPNVRFGSTIRPLILRG